MSSPNTNNTHLSPKPVKSVDTQIEAVESGNTSIKSAKDIKIWGPVPAILVSVAAYIFSQIFLALPLGVISALNPNESIDSILSGSSWIEFILAIFSAIGLLFVLWLFLRFRHQNFSALGFKKLKLSDFGWLAFVIIIYIVLLTVGMTIASQIPGFNADQQQEIGYKGGSSTELLVAFLGLVVLPPLAEEMLFRGFMYRGLASRWPKILAAVVTSLLFALVHFQWNVGVDVFILSMVLIFLYEKTKNLWMCVFLHAIKNGLAFIMLFFVT